MNRGAWIPGRIAAAKLRDLARGLGILSQGLPVLTLSNGTRLITAEAEQSDPFPIQFDRQTRALTLPSLYLDFFTWQYIAPQTVFGGPSSTQDRWLRMVVSATYSLGDYWDFDPPTGESTVSASIGLCRFEWVDAKLPPPPDPPSDIVLVSSAPGIVEDVAGDYYFWLVRITDGVIVYKPQSALLRGWPMDNRA